MPSKLLKRQKGKLPALEADLNNSILSLLQKFGARIIIHGAHIGEAKEYAETLVEKEELIYVNGYDDPPIIAGAGTIGMEVSRRNFRFCRSLARTVVNAIPLNLSLRLRS